MENGKLMDRAAVKEYLGIGETTLGKMVKLGRRTAPRSAPSLGHR